MTTFFPMMACGPSFGPEILLIFVPWLVGIVAGFINLVIICRRLGESSGRFRDPAIFLGYLGLAWAFIQGAFGPLNNGMTTALFFAIPAMPIGHFCYLLFVLARERQARKMRKLDEASGLAKPEGAK